MPRRMLNQANVLKMLGRLEEALAGFDRALALQARMAAGRKQSRHGAAGAGAVSRRRWRDMIARWRRRRIMPKR